MGRWSLKTWRQRSQEWAHRFEGLHPSLGKGLLNYASQIFARSLFGTSFTLNEWSDDQIGVRVETSSLGTLISLSEFMIVSLLGRHLPRVEEAFKITGAQVRLQEALTGEVLLRTELSAADREEWMRELYAKGMARRERQLLIWSNEGIRLGEIELDLTLLRTPALPPTL